MMCPSCKRATVRTTKTLEAGLLVHRNHACACGARWSSEQRPIMEALVVPNGHICPPDPDGAAICDQGTLETGAKPPEKAKDLSDPDPNCLNGFLADPDLSQRSPLPDPILDHPSKADRARGNLYSQAFRDCWQAYGRKEQKGAAYANWVAQARLMGGEAPLRSFVLEALVWQGPQWAADGWRYAPYFERYLKRRRWEDQPLPSRNVPRATQSIVDAGKAWLAKKGGGG